MSTNDRDISIEPGGRSRIRLPSGDNIEIIRAPVNGEQRFDANEVEPPRRLTRFNPGYLSQDLSAIFDIDFQGAKGVTQDVLLTYPLNDVVRGLSEPGPTFQVTTNDTVQSFTDAQLLVGIRQARAMLITPADNPIRFSFISNPDQTNAGHFVATNESILIEGIELLAQMNWINANNLAQSEITFSPRT